MKTDPMEAQRRRERNNRIQKDALKLMKVLPAACTNELAAVEFLERQRWGDTPACPKCGDTSVYQMRDRATGNRNTRYLWRCNGCNGQYTVRVGTVFEDSRIPLRHWCYAFWQACAGKKGVSAMQIRRVTQVSYKAALFMMHRIRYAMTPNDPRPPKLDGTVEADETFVGGRTRSISQQEYLANKARGVERPAARVPSKKTPVIAMIERGGQARALVIPTVTAHNVRQALLRNVATTAHLMTDEGYHYRNVGKPFASHGTVKHSIYEYVRGNAHINTAEAFFSRLKRQIFGTHHSVSPAHLHRYVAEVVFKHNTRDLDDGQRVVEAIKGAEGKRLSYQQPIHDAALRKAIS